MIVEKRIKKLIETALNITPNNSIIVSVSGGIDSMALIFLLNSLKYPLVAVHFNHQTRGQSNVDEEELIKSFCSTNNIPLHIEKLTITGKNFQEKARKLRLNHLKNYADKYHTPYIATAHHLDDLAETILMKITRGSNLLGYAGFDVLSTYNTYTFMKPFIYTSKDEIKTYVFKHKIPYLDDVSNFSDNYLRNRYRNTIIPLMKKENPNFLESIIDFHKRQLAVYKSVRSESLAYLNADYILDIPSFSEKNSLVKEDILAITLEHYDLPVFTKRLYQMLKIISSNRPNQKLYLNNHYYFIKAYDKAYIKHLDDLKQVAFKVKVSEGTTILPNMDAFTLFYDADNNSKHYTKLCYNKLAFPLYLRTRKSDDVLTYPYGHKKLSRLLIDRKVPKEHREKIILLCDANDEILWIKDLYLNQTLGNDNCLYLELEGDNYEK